MGRQLTWTSPSLLGLWKSMESPPQLGPGLSEHRVVFSRAGESLPQLEAGWVMVTRRVGGLEIEWEEAER